MYYFELFDVIFLAATSYLMGAMGGGAWVELKQLHQSRFGALIAFMTVGLVIFLAMLMVKGEC